MATELTEVGSPRPAGAALLAASVVGVSLLAGCGTEVHGSPGVAVAANPPMTETAGSTSGPTNAAPSSASSSGAGVAAVRGARVTNGSSAPGHPA